MFVENNEAIETVAQIANRGLDAINKICNVLDNIDDLSKDGKIFKLIPKTKLKFIFDELQKTVDIFTSGLSTEIKNKEDL